MLYEEKKEIVLIYMEPGKWISPTEIGGLFGGHSSIGSPLCKKMVAEGLLERNKRGHYRLKK